MARVCVIGTALLFVPNSLAQTDATAPPRVGPRVNAGSAQPATDAPPAKDGTSAEKAARSAPSPGTGAQPRPDEEREAIAPPPTTAPAAQQPETEAAGSSETATTVVKRPESYRLWVLAPAIIAIVLAIFTRQVVPALVVGIVVGSYMMVPCLPVDHGLADDHPVIAGFRLAMEKYVIEAIHQPPSKDYAHIKIMMFTLIIGFMVGVIGRSGGTTGLVNVVAGKTESPRRAGLTAWLAGMVVFFDDYANTMIIGPTMRSVFDKVKMSRAKLAYIVDSTAAPVASLALIGTWIGAEIGFIQDGLNTFSTNEAPAVLLNSQGSIMTGMDAFIRSLPYRFYPIFAIFLVFLIALTRRDFGPMKRAESRALSGEDEHPYDARLDMEKVKKEQQPKPRWWLGLIPVLTLVGLTIAVLAITGLAGVRKSAVDMAQQPWWEQGFDLIRNADSYLAILYGAIGAAMIAVILNLVARGCTTEEATTAGLDGMARMFPAIVILILAWALSNLESDLQLGKVLAAYLKVYDFPALWMPLAVFVCSAIISFATGTSWGTMAIMCPLAVTTTVPLVSGGDIDPEKGLTLLYASVGAVLAGAVFGDHCSPISDTTVLSSVASGCRHEDHVWTQIPYALLAAAAAMGFGDLMCSVYDQPWYYGIAAGAIFLILFVLTFGRRAKEIITLPPPQPVPLSRLRDPSLAPPPAGIARRAEDPSWQGPPPDAP